jgi:hypothetical protein
MKRIVALVFVVAVLMSTVFVAPVAATPGDSQGQGNGQLGPGNGTRTDGSCFNPGERVGALFKCPI